MDEKEETPDEALLRMVEEGLAGGRKPIHVYPVNDLIDHEINGGKCVCGPRVEDDGMVIVHHSLDGREKKEAADGAA